MNIIKTVVLGVVLSTNLTVLAYAVDEVKQGNTKTEIVAENKQHSELKAFFKAVRKNDLEKVEEMLKKFPGFVSEYSKKGYTALHIAAYRGYHDMVKLLLKHGADVNAKSNDKNRTPLHSSTSKNKAEVTSILLENGEDKSIKDSDGKLPSTDAIPAKS